MEGIERSEDFRTVCSWSHDEKIRVWDGTLLMDDDEEEGEEIDTMKIVKEAEEGREEESMDDEDDWEDMEDSEEESDDGGGKPFAKLKTDEEKFFEDL